MPADAEIVAILRKNFVVLWAPANAGKSSKRKPAAKIREIDDLAGHKQQTSGCLEPFLEAYLGEH